MNLRRLLLIVINIFILLNLNGCASGFGSANYSFVFDMKEDHQDARVLDYRYSSGSRVIAQASKNGISSHGDFPGENRTGVMPIGTELYVKWQDKKSGAIYEDTVSLVGRLYGDLNGKEIHFMIKGSQLYIYLISDQRRPPDKPPIGPSISSYLDTTQVYP